MNQTTAFRLLPHFVFVLFATLCSTGLFAQDLYQGNRLNLTLSAAAIDEEEPIDGFDELNDEGTGHLSIGYEYGFNRILSIGAGYLSGDSEEVTFLTDLFTNSELKYSALFGSMQLRIPLSQKNSLFLNVRRYDYEYEVIDDNIIYATDEGSDTGYTYGWQIMFNETFGMEVGREHMPLGDSLSITGARVGMSYSF